ncbi:RING-H2 finger protein ATL74-like [Ziziphus jujuba]|uniref:RING-H2 finger protein ATL74-like n=1 Tax=Ziziphus jujuba TaxID=326968 RepID=A0A6P6FNH9_ZIZJJ|nr:RING-H2 finger protein ATL74-like [Ziziphus jujuba]
MGLIYGDILYIPRCMGARILIYLKMMIMMARTHLGLHKHNPNSELEEYSSGSGSDHSESQSRSPNYIVVMDGMCPCPVSVPLHLITACIKKRLPVVEFAQILDQIGNDDDTEEYLAKTMCPICLDCIERSHEIRNLSNCDHIFHRDCLDCWVDEGQLTCPLCRSMLFPAAHGQRTILQEIHSMNIINN